MLTVCIPIYNFNVSGLVTELSKQISELNNSAELVLIDDCSSSEFKKINETVCSKENYIQLKHNIGRSKIRNLFLDYAKNDCLLFLDCDSLIISESFISDYIKYLSENKIQVVCGGRVYNKEKPGREYLLRWKYGIEKESKPYNIRKLVPNSSFMTNNFAVNKLVLKENKFDERIAGYGHEDTLFGYMLKQNAIEVHHINNPILNGDLETNKEYIFKTEEGIKNLILILNYITNINEFSKDVTILSFYNKLKTAKLTFLVHILFVIFSPFIKFLLINGFVSIRLFNFYKLGVLESNYNILRK